MFNFLLFFFLLPSLSLFAIKIDPQSTCFSEKEKKRIESYDFTGHYPELTHIEIDARRKMHVDMDLSGHYPVLEKISFEGGFGTISGQITGEFPLLKEISIKCTKATLNLDFEAKWTKECLINITCQGNSTIKLPKDIGCHVTVISSPFGKVENLHSTLVKRKTKLGKSIKRIFMTPEIEGEKRFLKIIVTGDRSSVVIN